MTLTLPPIADIGNPALAQRLQHRLDQQAKPPGTLGRLESLALHIGLIQQTESPEWIAPQLLVFAGDHGLATRGVSLYPIDVTWQMVENYLAGGGAVNVLARQHGLTLTVIDAGVNHTFAPCAGLLDRKVGMGTADALSGPAMSEAQCEQAIEAGREIVRQLPGNVVLLGDMGIGNSSSSALLLARLAGEDLSRCVGAVTGLDDRAQARKLRVLKSVLHRHRDASSPLAILAALGGFETAMLVGAVLQAAAERRTIVVDGFTVGAAVLAASRLVRAVVDYCVLAHRSIEPGHALMIQHVGGQPLLDLGLRLGEASGAALAWPLLDSAVRLLNEMASFESAGVSSRL